jgi:glycerol-3-phosphate dehydrogenase
MMRRNLSDFTTQKFDLIVVGGGIFGICAAWDAILRGLSVALLEKGDFAHATSANCFKIVHSGIRYLQHADLLRIRDSNKELCTLLRTAPHLVYPLPVLVPTYGYGLQSKALLRTAKLIYDVLTIDRSLGFGDIRNNIPQGHIISKEDCLEFFPGLKRDGLSGGFIFYDGQMYSPARLALSYLRSALMAGAEAANYIEVTDFIVRGNRVEGVDVEDRLTGERFQVLGKLVLNAAGPWAENLLRLRIGNIVKPIFNYSRDAFVVVPRRLTGDYALAVLGRTSDLDALLSRGRRHLFIIPWRKSTIIGCWHRIYRADPDEFAVTQEDIQGFLKEINEAYPAFSLTIKDISMCNAGIVPFGDNEAVSGDFSFGKRSRIIDHATDHNVEGLLTVIGVRYTTSRSVAERVVDLVCRKLNKTAPRSQTGMTPIYGGSIGCFEEFLAQTTAKLSGTFRSEVIQSLLHNHGSEYQRILDYVDEDPSLGEALGKSNVMKAEVVAATRVEMALKLGDVVFRRTDLGTAGYPGESEIRVCAELMAKELGWNEARLRNEINEVNSVFPNF